VTFIDGGDIDGIEDPADDDTSVDDVRTAANQ
jgi:hypothetical protein